MRIFDARNALTLAAALAACTPAPERPHRSAEPSTAPLARDPSAQGAPSLFPSAGNDQCGASEHQAWLGRPVESLPSPPSDATWRVVCDTCSRTEDHRPDRMNIEFDDASRRITSISCG